MSGKSNGKGGVSTGTNTTGRVIRSIEPETTKVNVKAVQKTAQVRELLRLPRRGSANIVEREGKKYLALTLDGTAIQIANDASVINWLIGRLDDLVLDKGEDKTKEVPYPIKAVW